VAGVGIKNRDPNYEYTVGFANDKAQYWVNASADTGFYSSANMRAGNYTMTVYKNELAVYTGSVTVIAGQTTILNSIVISADPSDDSAIWRIGDWDGTPNEFLNGDKLTTMHPSDPRLQNWDPSNFIIGTSDDSTFPAYMWKDINNDHIVYFKLSSSQLAQSHTLRIGITCAYSNGRPYVTVNDWVSAITWPSTQPKTRSLTTGSYRGNNVTYQFDVPASAWKQNSGEWNILKVSVISGSGLSGFLSAGMSVDSIDLLSNAN
jgi:rhamnogalacturonan endolyase